jgi:diguanylate cyclase (GGDEF)-like protein/PAS domain S-box-containing protein
VAEVFGRDVFEGVRPHIERAFAGETVSFALRNTVAGAPDQMEVHYIPDRDSEGRVVGVVGMVLDQTAQHEAREQVLASERQLRAVTDNLPVLIAYVDPAERLVFLNGTFREWLGVDRDEAAGRPMIEVIGAELYAQRHAQLQLALAGERQEFDVESRTRRGRRHLHTIYIPDRGDDGTVRGVFTLSMDVTRLKLVEEQLRNLSTRDALTGLPNRRQLDDRLGLALARHQREQAPLALMFLDIDHFKQINDSHGHGAGDTVLQQFAARLAAAVRDSDTVARLAGDEFIVIIEGMKDAADAVQVADKILEAVRRPMQLERLQLSVTTSIGIAVCTGARYVEGVGWGDGVLGPRADQIGALTRARLMEAADRALYQAKHAGRDCYRIEQLGTGSGLLQLP